MATPTRPYHHGDLRRAAREAAEALLIAQGVDAVSMREIAKTVGVTHRAIYRWFPDRDTLLADLAAITFERLAAAVERAIADVDQQAVAAAFVTAYVRFAVGNAALYRLAMSRDRHMIARHPALQTATTRIIAVSLRAFEVGSPSPRDDVIALWSMLHGLHDLYASGLLRARDDDAFVTYAASLSARLFRSTQAGTLS